MDVHSTSDIDLVPPMTLLKILTKYFGGYVVIIAAIFGLFGNVVSLAIFVRQRHRESASAMFLGALAVADFGSICAGINYWFYSNLYLLTDRKVNIPVATTKELCIAFKYFWLNCNFLSGWIIIAFSVERTIAVWFPLKVATLLTNKRRRNGLLGLFGFSLVLWTTCIPAYDLIDLPGQSRLLCLFNDEIRPRWMVIGLVVQIESCIRLIPEVCIILLPVS
jgi:hypothetical protein